MKSISQRLLFILALTLSAVHPSQAQETRYLTATLLPAQAKAAQAGPDGLWWVRQSSSTAVDPNKDVFIQFDLSALPRGLAEGDIKKASLRLVAKNVIYQPQGDRNTGGTVVLVKGQMAKDDLSDIQSPATIAALSTLTEKNPVALQAGEALRKAVYQQYSSASQKISLRLFSESHKSSALLYSPEQFGGSQSNIPRLVIEYTLGPPALLESLAWSQHQHDPEHTGRSTWVPFQSPNGFTLSKIPMPKIDGQTGGIADYPLIYQGNLYVVYKVGDANYLLALDFKDGELWRRDIGKGTVQRFPVISPRGLLYVVTGESISGYDLNDSGRATASYPLSGKLSDFTDLTIGNDGSLFAAIKESDTNSFYGFTPALKPFLKSGPYAKGQEKISTMTVSAGGQQVFAEIPTGAVVIDVANPSQIKKIGLAYDKNAPWEYYHAPVAAPAGGVMVYADFTSTANKGNVWGVGGTGTIWNAADTLIPQPVLGSNGIVYTIQGGKLTGHRYDQVGSATIVKDDGLNATSNLVMDGADNIYFWDNGNLHGYGPNGDGLFEKVAFTDASALEKERSADPETVSGTTKAGRTDVAAGPEQFIRLMMGPDGTLWANNKSGDALYAFVPRYAVSDPVLIQKLQTRTFYRATGVLTVGPGVSIPAGTQIVFQAAKGISLPPGFSVDKGASVLCRTGF